MASLPPPLTRALTGGFKSVSHFGKLTIAPFTLRRGRIGYGPSWSHLMLGGSRLGPSKLASI